MEIHLDKRGTKQIRLAAQEAIEEGDSESLRDEILEAFTEEQVEEIERRLDSADFYEFLSDVLDEWGGDDVDELMELLETQLAETGIDVKFDSKPSGDSDEDGGTEDDADDEPDDVDDEDEDDEDGDDEEAAEDTEEV